MDGEKLYRNLKIPAYVLLSVLIVWVFFLIMRPIDQTASDLQWEQKETDFWQLQRHDRRFWHEDAVSYCRQLTLDKHYDWRLPSVEELESLTKVTAGKRRLVARVERAIYWTATPADKSNRRYWAFSFLTEKAAPMTTHNYNSVVCVRNVN